MTEIIRQLYNRATNENDDFEQILQQTDEIFDRDAIVLSEITRSECFEIALICLNELKSDIAVKFLDKVIESEKMIIETQSQGPRSVFSSANMKLLFQKLNIMYDHLEQPILMQLQATITRYVDVSKLNLINVQKQDVEFLMKKLQLNTNSSSVQFIVSLVWNHLELDLSKEFLGNICTQMLQTMTSDNYKEVFINLKQLFSSSAGQDLYNFLLQFPLNVFVQDLILLQKEQLDLIDLEDLLNQIVDNIKKNKCQDLVDNFLFALFQISQPLLLTNQMNEAHIKLYGLVCNMLNKLLLCSLQLVSSPYAAKIMQNLLKLQINIQQTIRFPCLPSQIQQIYQIHQQNVQFFSELSSILVLQQVIVLQDIFKRFLLNQAKIYVQLYAELQTNVTNEGQSIIVLIKDYIQESLRIQYEKLQLNQKQFAFGMDYLHEYYLIFSEAQTAEKLQTLRMDSKIKQFDQNQLLKVKHGMIEEQERCEYVFLETIRVMEQQDYMTFIDQIFQIPLFCFQRNLGHMAELLCQLIRSYIILCAQQKSAQSVQIILSHHLWAGHKQLQIDQAEMLFMIALLMRFINLTTAKNENVLLSLVNQLQAQFQVDQSFLDLQLLSLIFITFVEPKQQHLTSQVLNMFLINLSNLTSAYLQIFPHYQINYENRCGELCGILNDNLNLQKAYLNPDQQLKRIDFTKQDEPVPIDQYQIKSELANDIMRIESILGFKQLFQDFTKQGMFLSLETIVLLIYQYSVKDKNNQLKLFDIFIQFCPLNLLSNNLALRHFTMRLLTGNYDRLHEGNQYFDKFFNDHAFMQSQYQKQLQQIIILSHSYCIDNSVIMNDLSALSFKIQLSKQQNEYPKIERIQNDVSYRTKYQNLVGYLSLDDDIMNILKETSNIRAQPGPSVAWSYSEFMHQQKAQQIPFQFSVCCLCKDHILSFNSLASYSLNIIGNYGKVSSEVIKEHECLNQQLPNNTDLFVQLKYYIQDKVEQSPIKISQQVDFSTQFTIFETVYSISKWCARQKVFQKQFFDPEMGDKVASNFNKELFNPIEQIITQCWLDCIDKQLDEEIIYLMVYALLSYSLISMRQLDSLPKSDSDSKVIGQIVKQLIIITCGQQKYPDLPHTTTLRLRSNEMLSWLFNQQSKKLWESVFNSLIDLVIDQQLSPQLQQRSISMFNQMAKQSPQYVSDFFANNTNKTLRALQGMKKAKEVDDSHIVTSTLQNYVHKQFIQRASEFNVKLSDEPQQIEPQQNQDVIKLEIESVKQDFVDEPLNDNFYNEMTATSKIEFLRNIDISNTINNIKTHKYDFKQYQQIFGAFHINVEISQQQLTDEIVNSAGISDLHFGLIPKFKQSQAQQINKLKTKLKYQDQFDILKQLIQQKQQYNQLQEQTGLSIKQILEYIVNNPEIRGVMNYQVQLHYANQALDIVLNEMLDANNFFTYAFYTFKILKNIEQDEPLREKILQFVCICSIKNNQYIGEDKNLLEQKILYQTFVLLLVENYLNKGLFDLPISNENYLIILVILLIYQIPHLTTHLHPYQSSLIQKCQKMINMSYSNPLKRETFSNQIIQQYLMELKTKSIMDAYSAVQNQSQQLVFQFYDAFDTIISSMMMQGVIIEKPRLISRQMFQNKFISQAHYNASVFYKSFFLERIAIATRQVFEKIKKVTQDVMLLQDFKSHSPDELLYLSNLQLTQYPTEQEISDQYSLVLKGIKETTQSMHLFISTCNFILQGQFNYQQITGFMSLILLYSSHQPNIIVEICKFCKEPKAVYQFAHATLLFYDKIGKLMQLMAQSPYVPDSTQLAPQLVDSYCFDQIFSQETIVLFSVKNAEIYSDNTTCLTLINNIKKTFNLQGELELWAYANQKIDTVKKRLLYIKQDPVSFNIQYYPASFYSFSSQFAIGLLKQLFYIGQRVQQTYIDQYVLQVKQVFDVLEQSYQWHLSSLQFNRNKTRFQYEQLLQQLLMLIKERQLEEQIEYTSIPLFVSTDLQNSVIDKQIDQLMKQKIQQENKLLIAYQKLDKDVIDIQPCNYNSQLQSPLELLHVIPQMQRYIYRSYPYIQLLMTKLFRFAGRNNQSRKKIMQLDKLVLISSDLASQTYFKSMINAFQNLQLKPLEANSYQNGYQQHLFFDANIRLVSLQRNIYNTILFQDISLNFQRNPAQRTIIQTMNQIQLFPFDIYFMLMLSDLKTGQNFTNEAYRIGILPNYRQQHKSKDMNSKDMKIQTQFGAVHYFNSIAPEYQAYYQEGIYRGYETIEFFEKLFQAGSVHSELYKQQEFANNINIILDDIRQLKKEQNLQFGQKTILNQLIEQKKIQLQSKDYQSGYSQTLFYQVLSILYLLQVKQKMIINSVNQDHLADAIHDVKQFVDNQYSILQDIIRTEDLKTEHSSSIVSLEKEIKRLNAEKDTIHQNIIEAYDNIDVQQDAYIQQQRQQHQQINTEISQKASELEQKYKQVSSLQQRIDDLRTKNEEIFQKKVTLIIQYSDQHQVPKHLQQQVDACFWYQKLEQHIQSFLQINLETMTTFNSKLSNLLVEKRILKETHSSLEDNNTVIGLDYPLTHKQFLDGQSIKTFACSQTTEKPLYVTNIEQATSEQIISLSFDQRQQIKDSSIENGPIALFKTLPTFTNLCIQGDILFYMMDQYYQQTFNSVESLNHNFSSNANLQQDALYQMQRSDKMQIKDSQELVKRRLRTIIQQITQESQEFLNLHKNDLPQHLKQLELNIQDGELKKITNLLDFERSSSKRQDVNQMLSNMISQHQYQQLDYLCWAFRDTQLEENVKEKRNMTFYAQIDQYNVILTKLNQITSEIIHDNEQISFSKYLVQLGERMKQEISSQSETNQYGACQILALLNTVMPGKFKEMNGIQISNLAAFTNIFSIIFKKTKNNQDRTSTLRQQLIESVQYRADQLDLEQQTDVSQARKVFEGYASFALIHPEIALEQILKCGLILRSVGDSNPKSKLIENQNICSTNGGDIGNLSVLLLFLIQQTVPSSIAPSPFTVLQASNSEFNTVNQTNFFTQQKYEQIIDLMREQYSYIGGYDKNFNMQYILSQQYQADSYLIQETLKTLILQAMFACIEPVQNLQILKKCAFLAQIILKGSFGRDVRNIKYTKLVQTILQIVTFVDYVIEQIKQEDCVIKIMTRLNQLGFLWNQQTCDFQYSGRELSLLISARLLTLTVIQKCAIQLNPAKWIDFKQQLIYVRLTTTTNLMKHALYCELNPFSAYSLIDTSMSPNDCSEKLLFDVLKHAKDQQSQSIVMERFRIIVISLVNQGNLQQALDKLQALEQVVKDNRIKLDQVYVLEHLYIKAFIYEIFIDLGQVVYQQASSELFLEQYKQYTQCQQTSVVNNRQYYGYFVTFEESLDSYLRSQYPLFIQKSPDISPDQFKTDVYKLSLNIFNSTFNVASYTKLQNMSCNLEKIVQTKTDVSHDAFINMWHYFIAPPKYFNINLEGSKSPLLMQSIQEQNNDQYAFDVTFKDHFLQIYSRNVLSLTKSSTKLSIDSILIQIAFDYQPSNIFLKSFDTLVIMRQFVSNKQQSNETNKLKIVDYVPDYEKIHNIVIRYLKQICGQVDHKLGLHLQNYQYLLQLSPEDSPLLQQIFKQFAQLDLKLKFNLLQTHFNNLASKIQAIFAKTTKKELCMQIISALYLLTIISFVQSRTEIKTTVQELIQQIYVPDRAWVNVVLQKLALSDGSSKEEKQLLSDIKLFMKTDKPITQLINETTIDGTNFKVELQKQIITIDVNNKHFGEQVQIFQQPDKIQSVLPQKLSLTNQYTEENLIYNAHFFKQSEVLYLKASEQMHIHIIDGVPFIQVDLQGSHGEQYTLLLINQPQNPELSQIVTRAYKSFSLEQIYLFDLLYQKCENIFADSSSKKQQPRLYLTAQHFCMLYPTQLRLKQVMNVSSSDFNQNSAFHYKFKYNLCDSIAQLMLFHQLLGTKHQVKICFKTVDIISGQFINAVRMNWESPIQNDTYIEYARYAVFANELMQNVYIQNKQESIKNQLQLRVIIDKYTLSFLKPHFAIGNISSVLTKKIKAMCSNFTIGRFDISYITQAYEQSSHYTSNMSVDFSVFLQIQLAEMLIDWALLMKEPIPKKDVRYEVLKAADLMCRALSPMISSLQNDEEKRNLMLQNADGFASAKSKSGNQVNVIIEWVVQAISGYYK
ncbi:Conserved_hypothetical protein [Hexamita inflata]|uniref:Uncharacterized protein n=1 Tax=Hexamita inflata TaxID=28002 RepID=A0AA86PC07_9EUKA|nr:Conserved hypothetical protein [Hexamita inflata]